VTIGYLSFVGLDCGLLVPDSDFGGQYILGVGGSIPSPALPVGLARFLGDVCVICVLDYTPCASSIAIAARIHFAG